MVFQKNKINWFNWPHSWGELNHPLGPIEPLGGCMAEMGLWPFISALDVQVKTAKGHSNKVKEKKGFQSGSDQELNPEPRDWQRSPLS